MHTRWLAGRAFTAVGGLLVMAGAFAGAGPAAASAASCQAWTGAQPPSPGTLENALSSVAVLSPCDVWAVGLDLSGGAYQTLIEHWNGSSWAQVDSPDPGSGNNFLNSVRAASASSVWAVGSASDGTTSKTLIEHWDGTAWTTVPSPSPGSVFNQLNGVRVVSASDAWAVGAYGDGNGTHRKTLVLHWDGATWAQVASPNPGTLSELFGVGATSASNAWAVGEVTAGTTEQTLVLHWDGRMWARVASPDPGGQAHDNRLDAVAVTSATSAWAVGTYETSAGPSNIVLHWNGRTWAHVNSPNPGTENGLFGVAATSASNAWAVGYFKASGPDQALALHCC